MANTLTPVLRQLRERNRLANKHAEGLRQERLRNRIANERAEGLRSADLERLHFDLEREIRARSTASLHEAIRLIDAFKDDADGDILEAHALLDRLRVTLRMLVLLG